MWVHSSVIFLVFIAATAPAAALDDGDCPKQYPDGMRSIRKCCELAKNPKWNLTAEQKAAIQSCTKLANTASGLAAAGYGCFTECLLIRMGQMGEDKTLNKEKYLKDLQNELHEDFFEPAEKARDLCLGKKLKGKCPSGIDGVMECFTVQLMLNCPTQFWTDGEECKETRAFVEKCGENPEFRP